jgi:hypothetical protein
MVPLGFLYNMFILLIICFCFHHFTFSLHKSFSTPSSHLSLGLPTLLLPSASFSEMFLITLVWSILITCPIHSLTSQINIWYHIRGST